MDKNTYRGKRKDNGEWVQGSLLYDRENNEAFIAVSFEDRAAYLNEVIPETVGQCTGLEDKNGKAIFEGDIFEFPDEVWWSCYTSCGTEYDSCEVKNYGVIGFCDYFGRFDFVRYKFNENSVEADLHENREMEFHEFVCELEIIGNIHDNPEILEGA